MSKQNPDPTSAVLRNEPTRLERLERPAPELTPKSPPPPPPAVSESTERPLNERLAKVRGRAS